MKQIILLLFSNCLLFAAQAQTFDSASVDDSIFDTTPNSVIEQDSELGSWLTHRFKVKAGAYFPLNNTNVKVGGANGNFGTEIDFEDDLGFTSYSTSFIADLNWRVSRRSTVAFEYYYLGRKSTKKLDREINFGENTYPINAEVSAFFNTQIARFSYGYAFISKPKIEAGVLIGAHFLISDVGLRLESNFIQDSEIKDNFDFVAPLPDIGLWGNFGIAKRMELFANANYFYIQVGDYTGSIISYSLSLSYNVYRNLDVELGYTGLNFEVDVEKQRLDGVLKWGYNGPSLKVAYSFGRPVKFKNK